MCFLFSFTKITVIINKNEKHTDGAFYEKDKSEGGVFFFLIARLMGL